MSTARLERPDAASEADSTPARRLTTGWRAGLALSGLWLLLIEGRGWRPLLDASVPLHTVPLLIAVAGVALLVVALPDGVSRALQRTREALDRRHPLAAATLLYLVAWGGTMLSANGLYWDDWTLVGVPGEAVVAGYTEFGSPWLGHLHLALLEVGPWLYRVLTLGLMYGVGVAVHAISQRVPWLGAGERSLVVVLVLVLPLNSARHALIDLPYTISLALFFAAWYLLVHHRSPLRGTVWLATALFVLSYTTQSLLVFVVLPVAHLLVREVPVDTWSPSRLVRWAGRRWYLLASPVVFFVAKGVAFPAYGEYEGYNQLSLGQLGRAVLPVALTAVLLLAALAARRWLPHRLPAGVVTLAVGLLVGALGILPYLAVGHVPRFVEWNSRHQLLLPLGCALVAVGLVRLVRSHAGELAAIRVATAFVAVAVVYSAHLSVSFAVDWGKQRSVIAQLAASPDVQQHHTFVYFDRVLGQNANGRTWRPYEVNAFLATATGEETRLAVKPGAIPVLPEFALESRGQRYRASDHRFDPDEPLVFLEITGEERPMFWQTVDPPTVRVTTEQHRYDDLVP